MHRIAEIRGLRLCEVSFTASRNKEQDAARAQAYEFGQISSPLPPVHGISPPYFADE
jgi:hypothetical protein